MYAYVMWDQTLLRVVRVAAGVPRRFALLQPEVHRVTSTGLVVLMLSWTVCAWTESQRNNQFQASAVARRLCDRCQLECNVENCRKGPSLHVPDSKWYVLLSSSFVWQDILEATKIMVP